MGNVLLCFAIASIAGPAPVIALSKQWPFNPVLTLIALYLLSITIALPTAAIAALLRWGSAAKIELPVRQRWVDASIGLVASSAVLGWGFLAIEISGIGAKLGIGLRHDDFVFPALALVPPSLALASGAVALFGRGRGRAVVLSGFVLTLLGLLAGIGLSMQRYHGPAPSF
jgi:hypothetical protein